MSLAVCVWQQHSPAPPAPRTRGSHVGQVGAHRPGKGGGLTLSLWAPGRNRQGQVIWNQRHSPGDVAKTPW